MEGSSIQLEHDAYDDIVNVVPPRAGEATSSAAEESKGGAESAFASSLATATAGGASAPSSSSSTVVWDFRTGTMPPGVQIVSFGGNAATASVGTADQQDDTSPVFVPMRDGSNALRLPPQTFLKVDLSGSGLRGNEGSMINNYTLTMDICLDSAPDNPLSLLQTLGDTKRVSDGECFVYAGGGVGIFGEVGVADAAVQAQKWSRVVITMGDPQVAAARAARKASAADMAVNRSSSRRGDRAESGDDGSNSMSDNEEEEEEMEKGARPWGLRPPMSQASGMRFGSARSAGNLSNERCLTTYVNSRKCATVSSRSRGVLGSLDGRFSINPSGFNLFGSSQALYIPGISVKYVELQCTNLSDSEIKEDAYKNRIFSPWDQDQAKFLENMRANLALQPLYKSPPPIYNHPVFVAEVSDPYLEGTGMDGGSLVSSVATLSLCVERMMNTALSREGFKIPPLGDGAGATTAQSLSCLTFANLGFSHDDLQAINYLGEVLKQSIDLFQRFGMAQKNGPAQLIHFMKTFKARLKSLPEGGLMFVPGGIEGSTYLYIVEKQDALRYRFCVVNTDTQGGLEYHVSTAKTVNKLLYKVVFSVSDILPEKIMDDAFWGMLFKLAVFSDPKFNTPQKLYAWLLPYLVGKSTDHILSETAIDPSIAFRTPPRSNTGFLRCLLEASAFMLKTHRVTEGKCSIFFFLLRVQLIESALHDLKFVPYLRGSDRSVLQIAASQLAYSASKLGSQQTTSSGNDSQSGTPALLSVDALANVQVLVESLILMCNSPKLVDKSEQSFANPRPLVITQNAVPNSKTGEVFLPFCDRLLRPDDVNGLAGAPIVMPKYVPVDFLQIPVKIDTLEDAVAAIRYTDRLCTLISVQSHLIKNTDMLKVSLIQNTFTRLLPIPRAPEASDYSTCIWRTPMRYGLQLDLVICLGRLTEHFVSSVFSCPLNKPLDAVRIVVLWAITAIADAVLRLPKESILDQPSEFCLHLMGSRSGGLGNGYGLSSSFFASQVETIEIHHPELSITRTAVLDYFESQHRLSKIFNWNQGHMYEESMKEFLGQLCQTLAFPTDEKSMASYMTQRNALINKNYPEFHVYRDIAFYSKYVLNVDPRAFPPVQSYSQLLLECSWRFEEGAFLVLSMGGRFPMKCYPEPPFNSSMRRYPSFASPSHLAQPHQIATEDDVLHIKNLPSFEDSLGQQDAESLLSYLTVPYLRIPLVLSFFASEDRIHALKSADLQKVLDSVLFEPGKFLNLSDMSDIPQFVPSERPELLSTSYGFLLNEFQRSPEGMFRSLIALLKAAVNLDVGTVHSSTVPIILYILRLVARVESFVCFLIDHARGVHETLSSDLRGLWIAPKELDILENGKMLVRGMINQHVQKMIEEWNDELMKECAMSSSNSIVVDENTRISCRLHAHLLVLNRNIRLDEFNPNVASTIASSISFMTTRHTWNHNIFEDVPEHEIYEVIGVQRRRLIEWCRSQPQVVLDAVMDAVVKVTTDTGTRKKTLQRIADINDIPTAPLALERSHSGGNRRVLASETSQVWAFVGGPRSRGRFTQISYRTMSLLSRSNGISFDDQQMPVEIPDDVEFGIEIDLQTVQMTLKSAHLKALDSAIAADLDVQQIFGKKSMQVTTVEETEHRQWVSLIGRNHDIQYWRTPDARSCIQEFDRDYNPGELFGSEQWIAPIFEPVRLAYMVKPFVLQICMPEAPYSDKVDVASLVGIHPKNGGVWKEILVYKKLNMVQVFNVVSHGRRFYRVLEYTTDVRYTLRELQPSIDGRSNPWPVWERFGSGHPYDDHWGNPLSCVITRSRDHDKNLSGGTETFIPARLLYGTVPQALLDSYQFWQDEEDFIRGYPTDDAIVDEPLEDNTGGAINKNPYILLVRLVDIRPVPVKQEKGVCAHIRRVLKAPLLARKKKCTELLDFIDKSGIVLPSKTWKLDFSAFKLIGKIIDSGVEFNELLDFLQAFKLSGVQVMEISALLMELKAFADDQLPVSDILLKDVSVFDDLTLLSASYADPNSRLGNILLTMTRLDNIGHILCWTSTKRLFKGLENVNSVTKVIDDREVRPPAPVFVDSSSMDDIFIDLLELPRLKLSFHEKLDENGIKRLYSIDHSNLFVSNYRSDLISSLMRGVPQSLLLSTVDEELHILAPIINPVRPRIGSNPFSTELVLDRNLDVEWYQVLDTFYFVYPVHVSLSFLFTPTLSSALYLLLMRFSARNYAEVYRLANTIASDTEYSPEESKIFQALGRLTSDGHPDAHACRLKITSVLLDSPVICPWNVTRQMSRYITKLSHVSTACRLALSDELAILQTCVCSSQDPRFYDVGTGKPLYSEYEVCIVRNRLNFLAAMHNNSTSASADTVPRMRGSNWTSESNMNALMLPEGELMNIEISYAAPGMSSGHSALEIAHKFWHNDEPSSGLTAGLGFLYLYELLTGSKVVKILDVDCSKSFATLLAQFLSDKDEAQFLPSIISMMIRYPYLVPLMPKFKDTRQYKKTTMSASEPADESKSDGQLGPLGSLLSACVGILQSEIYNIMTVGQTPAPVSMFPVPTDDAVAVLVPSLSDVEKTRSWVIPTVSDYSNSYGAIKSINRDDISDLEIPIELQLSGMDVESFTSQPLKPINLDQFICFMSSKDLNLTLVADELPFDVSSHSLANSAVAKSMLQRLKTDVAEYANSINFGAKPRLSMVDNLLRGIMDQSVSLDTVASACGTMLNSLNSLIQNLEFLRTSDAQYVETALPWLDRKSNSINIPADSNSSSVTNDHLLFHLRRLSGQEGYIWLEFLFGTTLSSRQHYDLQRLNPFLTVGQTQILNSIAVAAILHANRIGQINRCLIDARNIQKSLLKLIKDLSSTSLTLNGDKKSLIHGIALKSESLVNNLIMGRYYIDRMESVVADESDAKRRRVESTDMFSYDPRFLLFEFTWNILLRKVQVEMVRDYISDLRNGKSSVKQMIMGAGKTTVVCPLLALILSDGNSLVVQVVPPALLDFSRSVMRSTFSSIMHKRIFTLQFDRSSEITPNMFTKLLQSRSTRGVVIATPTTIKSMMLKFIELMELSRESSEKLRNSNIHKDCQELGRILTLFKESILIMDEVDLILHPMKSELNFPIGPKQELDMSPQRWLLPIHILDAIYYLDTSRMSVGFKSSKRAAAILHKLSAVMNEGYQSRALQRNPHCLLLNVDWYHSFMKPILADWIFLWLEAHHLAGISQSDVYKFLMEGANSQLNPELAALIEAQLTVNHKKLLNLSRDWLDCFLPHILQKIDRVSFGIMNKADYERASKADPHMPRTRVKLAIPFIGKDVPSRSSEFAHPDIILGLTILAYRYEGLRWADFEELIGNLRSSLIKELGPWKLRKSAIRYSRWVRAAGGSIRGESKLVQPGQSKSNDLMADTIPSSGPSLMRSVSNLSDFNDDIAVAASAAPVEPVEVVSLRLLKRSNEQQMKKLYDLICKLPEAIHYYLENFIFPNYMDSKITKLSAAGQELGGEMLFSRRIGFSGTPSDLLPVELGKCGHEKKSDGQMVSVMTSTDVCSYEIIQENWTPLSILDKIAHAEDDPTYGRVHALIDTGALITGLSNLQVAQRLFVNGGLPWCEGIVFLDESDRKMILVRATGRVLKLAQSGITAEKRFAFYDQVHTTGMDIQHTLNACAVLTLSKDMVFRDYVQGAYRMRGINKGQRIHLFIIPEVKDLMLRELSHGAMLNAPDKNQKQPIIHALKWNSLVPEDIRKILIAVNAWLIINSIRSERVQFSQLCLQNVANVWRKNSYSSLLMRHHEITSSNLYFDVDAKLQQHLQTFCEPIDFSLAESMADPIHFSESLKNRIASFSHLIESEDQMKVINEVMELISHTSAASSSSGSTKLHSRDDVADAVLFDSEMVQEQEKEKEEEQEREQEQEIEIEKYVDLAYSREHEEPTPWPVTLLAASLDTRIEPFYPMNEFKLYKRSPLPFPQSMHLSCNYFNPTWTGARRLKNVVAVLDWIPDKSQLVMQQGNSYEPLSEDDCKALDTAIQMFDLSRSSLLSESQFHEILWSAVNVSMSKAETAELFRAHGVTSGPDGALSLPVVKLREMLTSGYFSRIQSGRRYVTISLAEAETLRRIIHMRSCGNRYTASSSSSMEVQSSSEGVQSWILPLIESSSASVAIRMLPDNFNVLDSSLGYVDVEQLASDTVVAGGSAGIFAARPSSFMSDAAEQMFRYFNSELFFSEKALNLILRSIHATSKQSRKSFYKHVIACRRRAAKKFMESSVAKLFSLASHFAMMKHRAVSLRLANGIRQLGLTFFDAFSAFDVDKNGLISPSELWGAFDALRIDLEAKDVLDFVASIDIDRDGNVSMKEFGMALEDPMKAEREQKRLLESENAVFLTTGPGGTGAVETTGGAMEVEDSAEALSDEEMQQDEETAPPPALVRNASSTGGSSGGSLVVVPRGEAQLRELQRFITREEEEAEAEELAFEEKQEEKIRKEIEEEEDEMDRLQEGGPNPSVSEDLVRFDFSTGRLPRRIASRGDAVYKTDEVIGKYLSVCPLSMVFATLPASFVAGDGSCGGRRLNRYSVVLEVMLEELPRAVGSDAETATRFGYTSMFTVPTAAGPGSPIGMPAPPPARGQFGDGEEGTEAGSGRARGGAGETPPLIPIFSTAPYAETEALLWVNDRGQIVDSEGKAFTRRDSGPRMAARKWHVLAVVVDTLEGGGVSVYLDGTLCTLTDGSTHTLDVKSGSFDGALSVGHQFSLFGSKGRAVHTKSCNIRTLSIHSRCLADAEVAAVTELAQRAAKGSAVDKVAEYLQNMGVEAGVARWVASTAEGDTLEQRINAALNIVYS